MGYTLTDNRPCSEIRSRVLIFNCTNGRSGNTFLGAMLKGAAEQLKAHGAVDTDTAALFDQVVFCANVTYADGGFKGGASISFPLSTSASAQSPGNQI